MCRVKSSLCPTEGRSALVTGVDGLSGPAMRCTIFSMALKGKPKLVDAKEMPRLKALDLWQSSCFVVGKPLLKRPVLTETTG